MLAELRALKVGIDAALVAVEALAPLVAAWSSARVRAPVERVEAVPGTPWPETDRRRLARLCRTLAGHPGGVPGRS